MSLHPCSTVLKGRCKQTRNRDARTNSRVLYPKGKQDDPSLHETVSSTNNSNQRHTHPTRHARRRSSMKDSVALSLAFSVTRNREHNCRELLQRRLDVFSARDVWHSLSMRVWHFKPQTIHPELERNPPVPLSQAPYMDGRTNTTIPTYQMVLKNIPSASTPACSLWPTAVHHISDTHSQLPILQTECLAEICEISSTKPTGDIVLIKLGKVTKLLG